MSDASPRNSLKNNFKEKSHSENENSAIYILIVLMIKKQILIQGNEKNKEAIY